MVWRCLPAMVTSGEINQRGLTCVQQHETSFWMDQQGQLTKENESYYAKMTLLPRGGGTENAGKLNVTARDPRLRI